MECLLSASVTGHLAFFAFPLSFALSESVSVSSFRLFCSLACWQALYRPWLFEAISKALSLASLKGMASLFFGEVLPCCRILPLLSLHLSATSLFLLCINFVHWNCPMQAIIALHRYQFPRLMSLIANERLRINALTERHLLAGELYPFPGNVLSDDTE